MEASEPARRLRRALAAGQPGPAWHVGHWQRFVRQLLGLRDLRQLLGLPPRTRRGGRRHRRQQSPVAAASAPPCTHEREATLALDRRINREELLHLSHSQWLAMQGSGSAASTEPPPMTSGRVVSHTQWLAMQDSGSAASTEPPPMTSGRVAPPPMAVYRGQDDTPTEQCGRCGSAIRSFYPVHSCRYCVSPTGTPVGRGRS